MIATFGLLSALNIGSLRAADVTWRPGAQPRAGAQRTETVANGMHRLTHNGYGIRGYMLLGWSDRKLPVVTSSSAEMGIETLLYRVGDAIDIQSDRTLYAVWAIDKDNNGSPDYNNARREVKDLAQIERGIAERERKKRAAETGAARYNLRAAAVSLPKWNIDDDILAYKDNVFYVGCVYNTDTLEEHNLRETIICWNKNENVFGGLKLASMKMIKAARDLELVFEYGGVLEDSCLTGGRAQKPITRILLPRDSAVHTLIMCDPIQFTRIKEDGDAVLKMYFVRKKTGNGPDTLANDASDWVVPPTNAWRYPGVGNSHPALFPHPFYNEETGEPSDTFTVRFKIYNQPKFASNIIRSRVHYRDTMRLNYGFVSGTDTKYMVRSLDGGWNWHPADSPLTDVERDLLQDDSVRVCLRQLDSKVGRSADLKQTYMDPNRFYYTGDTLNSLTNLLNGGTEEIAYRRKMGIPYYKSLFESQSATIQNAIIEYYEDGSFMGIGSGTWGPLSDEDKYNPEGGEFSQVLDNLLMDNFPLPSGHPLENFVSRINYPRGTDQALDAILRRNLNTVLGKELADKQLVPDWCRDESYCFYVKRDAPPVHQRSVFIPTVEGVTVVSPGVGYSSIPSQKNFTFRVKYAGEPMTVTAKRLIDGRTVEVLTGTRNADGEYEYVIRRVMQDLTLEFTKTVANTLVDQPSVWANSGAVRIHAPKETTVRIYSASGVLVKQATVQGDKTVPLAAGLYLVVLSDGTTQKVLVQ
ncbi:T9SS C-terminal target domain-containing protein [Tannerella serpentiformis]|nr:T9SS type A sorting domain-containing protein [Tannerella serpentiformis]AVV52591.1 T9SS C-terminal target domain-containing protein [Tannerella serpentiformis]